MIIGPAGAGKTTILQTAGRSVDYAGPRHLVGRRADVDERSMRCLGAAAVTVPVWSIYDLMVAGAGGVRLIGVLGVGVIDDPDRAVLRADDLGLTRGDGCFDATRVVTDADGTSRIDHLNAHLTRFQHSAAGLGIDCDVDAWRALINEAVEAWRQPGYAVLRVMLTRGRESAPTGPPTGVLTITPLDEAALTGHLGISVITLSRGHAADAFADAPWLLGGIKSLSYAINVSAGREATRRGADDVLFVSTDGYALEAPRSALVWREGERLATTRLDGTGILASITQAAAFAGATAERVSTSYELITIDDLHRTDGAWLLSSGRLVAPILQLDGSPLAHDAGWTKRLEDWIVTPGARHRL